MSQGKEKKELRSMECYWSSWPQPWLRRSAGFKTPGQKEIAEFPFLLGFLKFGIPPRACFCQFLAALSSGWGGSWWTHAPCLHVGGESWLEGVSDEFVHFHSTEECDQILKLKRPPTMLCKTTCSSSKCSWSKWYVSGGCHWAFPWWSKPHSESLSWRHLGRWKLPRSQWPKQPSPAEKIANQNTEDVEKSNISPGKQSWGTKNISWPIC